MTTIIYSRLLKADYLAQNSSIFPRLVRAACIHHNTPYSQAVVETCAANQQILDALEMTADIAIDEVLNNFAHDRETAPGMDNLILTAVAAYKEQEAHHGA